MSSARYFTFFSPVDLKNFNGVHVNVCETANASACGKSEIKQFKSNFDILDFAFFSTSNETRTSEEKSLSNFIIMLCFN